jgi:hypothetical protein
MLTPNEIIEELFTMKQTLWRLNGEIIKVGQTRADAERSYLKAKAIKTAEQRLDKIPATLIPDLVKGSDEVSDLYYAFQVADIMYDNKRENIRSVRDTISAYQSILAFMKIEYSQGA